MSINTTFFSIFQDGGRPRKRLKSYHPRGECVLCKMHWRRL